MKYPRQTSPSTEWRRRGRKRQGRKYSPSGTVSLPPSIKILNVRFTYSGTHMYAVSPGIRSGPWVEKRVQPGVKPMGQMAGE